MRLQALEKAIEDNKLKADTLRDQVSKAKGALRLMEAELQTAETQYQALVAFLAEVSSGRFRA